MIFRLIACLFLGLAAAISPAMAKDAPAEPEPPLPIHVDLDVTKDPDNVLFLDLSNGGRVAIRLMPQWAPNHVERIKTLTRSGFYDGLIFHRVIDGFMAQTGDPTGTGGGGSQLPNLAPEFTKVPHLRGTVSMARTNDPNSANSQFFIVFYPRFALDEKYSVFGRVIGGMDAVDGIERGEPPANPTRIVRARLATQGDAMTPLPSPSAPADAAISVDDLNASQSEAPADLSEDMSARTPPVEPALP